MKSMNISLPESMKDWVERQIATGNYASASDYVRDLIRDDREYRERREELIQALIEGEESGESDRTIEEIFAEARAELMHEAL
jgi:antitoxin ParD1/3/4